MTANAFREDRDACIAAGMDDHLAKPIEPKLLFAMLLKWLPAKESLSKTVKKPAKVVQEALPAHQPAALDENNNAGLFEHLEKLTAHKPGATRRILEQILAQHCNDEKHLQTFLANQDWKACFSVAHSIKGMAGQIGAVSLQKAAMVPELLWRKNEPVSMALVDKLIIQLNETLHHVEDYLAKHPDPAAEAVKLPIFSQALHLIDLLRSVDASAFEAAEKLREQLPDQLPDALRETFNQFFIHMRNYDMEAAADCLQSILPELEGVAK
jgi:HPt (histidine-containing phosphotransfer) domain-containing protein